MLSKEEVEKAKEDLMFFNEGDYITREMDRSADIIEEYVSRLESKVKAKEMEHEYDVNMIDEVKGEAVRLYKKIEKQEKIIDEMAEAINERYFDKNNFYLWFEKNIIKQKLGCLSDRIKIIKQYFEKKVEGK